MPDPMGTDSARKCPTVEKIEQDALSQVIVNQASK